MSYYFLNKYQKFFMKPPNDLAQKLCQFASTEYLDLLNMGGTEVGDIDYTKDNQ